MVNTLWFLVLAGMLTTYAVLDGFDLGVGVLHLLIARTPEDRATAIGAIGPVWNGNEVWLIAAGGSMVVAFPHLYAAAFSGFYLALMLVLWLLVLRGIGIEFRHQVDNLLWREAWDVTFSLSSVLLAVLFGAAVGNVLRGVPLDFEGNFQGSFVLLLNPFALLCGVLSVVTLAMHGASYLALKTTGALQTRARRATVVLWAGTLALLVLVAASSFVVQPQFTANFSRWPFLVLVPLLGLAAAGAIPFFARRERDGMTFVSTGALIVGVLGSAAAGLYPRLLPALPGSSSAALDIHNSASGHYSMKVALVMYLVGIAIVLGYLVKVYWVWRGKVTSEHGYRLP
ncbi:MAG TPA: cytochrome d ubiquinol oxidase subunit II [Vicinamibacterales bacterium]|jgi:cytochrome d ubiquinol oxidase subunit II